MCTKYAKTVFHCVPCKRDNKGIYINFRNVCYYPLSKREGYVIMNAKIKKGGICL